MLTLQDSKNTKHASDRPSSYGRMVGCVEIGEEVGEEFGMGPEPKHKHRVPHLCVHLGLSQRLRPHPPWEWGRGRETSLGGEIQNLPMP